MFKYVLVVSALAAVGSAHKLLYACNAANFGGYCFQFQGNINTCYSAGDLNDSISSVRVDPGYACSIYSDSGCKGKRLTVTSDINNLQNHNFNDVVSSMNCRLY
ncbi:hypothetical protein BGZ82_004192 [Podila clonocystis]|nr:hypothetical protein BGZ82_004192 [Podila clonocystis]